MKSNFEIPKRVKESIGRRFQEKVNCFCLSEYFFRQTTFRQMTADEMLDFVAQNFHQVSEKMAAAPLLTLLWSRSSIEVPLGQIQVKELVKRPIGFPFGLILEHSFVQVDDHHVYQKADPSPKSVVEILSLSEALKPYARLKGFEVTLHIPTPLTNKRSKCLSEKHFASSSIEKVYKTSE